MSVSDPISDLLATIRNGLLANLVRVSSPSSKIKKEMLKVLKDEGYIEDFKEESDKAGHKKISIKLKYFEGQPAIKEMKRISKPGLRVYKKVDDLPKFYNGLGISIISSSKGILADHKARELEVGGEVICNVF